MKYFVTSHYKIIVFVLVTILALTSVLLINNSKNRTPRQKILSYFDNTIAKINNDPYQKSHTTSFGDPSSSIIDSKGDSYGKTGIEEHMQIGEVEYLRNVKLYNQALATPALELGMSPDFEWLSHPMKDDIAYNLRTDTSINFENDQKLLKRVPKIGYTKKGDVEIFSVNYDISLEIDVYNLGGDFTGSVAKVFKFRDGLLIESSGKPSGEATKHLPTNSLKINYKVADLTVPKDVVAIETLMKAKSFLKAQQEINSQVFMVWVLREAAAKSNRDGMDYSQKILTFVVNEFIRKRYVPENTSLQIINGKLNLTVFTNNDNRDVNDPLTIIACGTLEGKQPVITQGRC